MNKEEALNKIEELKKYVEQCDNEDYCVGSFPEVNFDEENHNMLFKNGARVNSNCGGDGVYIEKKYIKRIEEDNYSFRVVFKGTTNDQDWGSKLLWSVN